MWGAGGGYSPAPKDRFRRADWLRDKMYVDLSFALFRLNPRVALTMFFDTFLSFSFFDGLELDDDYCEKRLGFKAPNIFHMSLCA